MSKEAPTGRLTRHYAAFGLGCLFFAYAFLQRVAPSVMTEELMRDFAVGGAALGSLSAFYFYAYASIQVPVGVLVDRYGPRRLLAGALLVCAAGSILFAGSDSLFIAGIGRAIIGATVAFGFVGTITIAAHWLPARQFPVLVGLVQSTGMAGAIAGQAPLSLAVEAGGWRMTIYAMAALGVVLGTAIFLVARDKKGGLSEGGSILGGLKQVIGRRQSWLCAFIGFTLTAPMLAFNGLWAVPWLVQTRGFETTEAGFLASIVFFGWMVGSPLYGWVSEGVGRRKPFFLAGLSVAALTLAALIYLPIQNAYVIGLLMFINGMSGCSLVLCFANVREVNRPANAGAAMGLVNMMVVGSGAVFQPVLGVLLDLFWDGASVDGVRIYSESAYGLAFASLFISYGVGLLAACVLRETYCRPLDQDTA